jgi:hypothetical protein
MYAIRLPKGTLIDPTTGTLYIEDATGVDTLLERLHASKTAPQSGGGPIFQLISATQDGFVRLQDGQTVQFKGKQWRLLRCLSNPDGRCSRLDALDFCYSRQEQLTSRQKADTLLRDLKDTVNNKLAKYRLFIDSDRNEFWLTAY